MKFSKIVAVIMLISCQAMAQNFEGVIVMNTTNKEMKEEATLTWYLQDERSRMDIVSQAGEHNTEYAIISDEKGLDMVAQGHVTAISPAVLKTDLVTQTVVSEKEGVKMNGYNCKQVVYSDGVNQTAYWLTEDLNISFDDIPAVLKRNMPTISSDGFPVRMEKRDKEGKVVFSQDVVSVTASKVDDSKFDR